MQEKLVFSGSAVVGFQHKPCVIVHAPPPLQRAHALPRATASAPSTGGTASRPRPWAWAWAKRIRPYGSKPYFPSLFGLAQWPKESVTSSSTTALLLHSGRIFPKNFQKLWGLFFILKKWNRIQCSKMKFIFGQKWQEMYLGMHFVYTVFPWKVSAETILFWIWKL